MTKEELAKKIEAFEKQENRLPAGSPYWAFKKVLEKK